jgi:CheY-like chemotaxis protein
MSDSIKPEILCLSILIADDNDGVRETLVSALKSRGYQAFGVRNGREALKVLPTLKVPTLVFLDLMMPLLNGWDLLELWSQEPNYKNNKVVTISAVNPKSRPDQRAPIGISGSLQKPLTISAVLQIVRRFCEDPAQALASGGAAAAEAPANLLSINLAEAPLVPI